MISGKYCDMSTTSKVVEQLEYLVFIIHESDSSETGTEYRMLLTRGRINMMEPDGKGIFKLYKKRASKIFWRLLSHRGVKPL